MLTLVVDNDVGLNRLVVGIAHQNFFRWTDCGLINLDSGFDDTVKMCGKLEIFWLPGFHKKMVNSSLTFISRIITVTSCKRISGVAPGVVRRVVPFGSYICLCTIIHKRWDFPVRTKLRISIKISSQQYDISIRFMLKTFRQLFNLAKKYKTID